MVERHQLRVLFTDEQIQIRAATLGRRITADYAGKDLAIVGVLKGSFVFLADLVRHIEIDCTVDFLGLSTYGDSSKASGVVQITSDLTMPVEDRDILIVEDIVESGVRTAYLRQNMQTRMPNSIKVCTLLHRPSTSDECKVDLDYVGFEIDHYVYGYGLDYAGLHRNVPFIGYTD